MKENLFTEEELSELKKTMNSIGSYLPTDKTHYIWTTYTKITGKKENKPCTCKSSANLWGKAVQTIREYLKEV